MKHRKLQNRTVRVLSGVGFTALAAEWLGLLFAVLVKFSNTALGDIVFPDAEVPSPAPIPAPSGVTTEQDYVTTFLITGVAMALLALVGYLVATRYTRAVQQTGEKVVREATKKTVPAVARKPLAKIPAKRRKVLTTRVAFWVKISLAVLPVVILPPLLHDDNRGLVELAAISLTAIASVLAVVMFTTQAWAVSRWHLKEAILR